MKQNGVHNWQLKIGKLGYFCESQDKLQEEIENVDIKKDAFKVAGNEDEDLE